MIKKKNEKSQENGDNFRPDNNNNNETLNAC